MFKADKAQLPPARQGSVAATGSHPAALSLHPVLQAADSKLREEGASVSLSEELCVLTISDDAHLIGHPESIVAVYPQYKENLKKIGGTVHTQRREAKNAALPDAECELLEDLPGPVTVTRKSSVRCGRYSMVLEGRPDTDFKLSLCVGNPVGNSTFVARFLELKEDLEEVLTNRPLLYSSQGPVEP